jgi:hypothetical protein
MAIRINEWAGITGLKYDSEWNGKLVWVIKANNGDAEFLRSPDTVPTPMNTYSVSTEYLRQPQNQEIQNA